MKIKIDKNRVTKKIPEKVINIIDIQVDEFLFDGSKLKNELLNAIDKKRVDTANDFEFPVVNIIENKLYFGIELFSISINSNQKGNIYHFSDIESVVNKLYSVIVDNKDEI